MDGLSALRENLTRLLKEDYRLSDAVIIGEFPAIVRDYPLEKPRIAVGIDSVEMDAGLGGFIGTGPDGDMYGKLLSVTMRLDVFTPALVPCDPYSIMDAVCEILMLSADSTGFFKLWSSGVAYDKSAEANRLTIKAAMKAAMTRGDDSAQVSAFRIEMKN